MLLLNLLVSVRLIHIGIVAVDANHMSLISGDESALLELALLLCMGQCGEAITLFQLSV